MTRINRLLCWLGLHSMSEWKRTNEPTEMQLVFVRRCNRCGKQQSKVVPNPSIL